MEFEHSLGERRMKISLEKKGDQTYEVRDGETVLQADIRQVSENELLILIGTQSFSVQLAPGTTDRTFVSVSGRQFILRRPEEETAGFEGGEEKAHEGQLRVKAPMPGKVIKIAVAEGEVVRKNQTLAIVEAMKMENELKAALEAVVKKIHAKAGDRVDSEKVLIELEPKPE